MSSKQQRGHYNAICDICGMKTKAENLIRNYNGFMVHKDPAFGCFETRHPLDFVRAKSDTAKLPFTRPDSDGVDVGAAINASTQTTIPTGTFTTNNSTF